MGSIKSIFATIFFLSQKDVSVTGVLLVNKVNARITFYIK